MEQLVKSRNILCIDLKSFFASVECVERQLDPFKTPLVVCDPNRNGAITLAVSPFLKKFGVKGRTRVYELPTNIDIIKVPPRMRLYQEKSKQVIDIYMNFVAAEDIHIYSIDEAFLDVTNYLHLYQKSDTELAQDILKEIYEKTGLTATVGIGPNLLLAKVSMDIEAKHNSSNIAKWEYEDIKTKLWSITPLSKMWGIGPRMEKRLQALGMYSVKDIATSDKNYLKAKFGVLGEELWYHANGIDISSVSELNTQVAKDKSFSHSQVLFKDYYDHNIYLIIIEMIELLCRRLRNHKMVTGLIGFGISYSKSIGGGFYHSIKLDTPTNDADVIYRTCMHIFDRYYQNKPIRKVSISIGHLKDDSFIQLTMFEPIEEIEDKNNINRAIDEIKDRFGPNTILKASSLLKDSTIKERNLKIGGHNAE